MARRGPKPRSWLERAAVRSVRLSNDCIECDLGVTANGYCIIHEGGKYEYIHRLSYKHFKGVIPEFVDVMHSCDNRRCWNPDHLSVGTRQNNLDDMVSKNRHLHGEYNECAKLSYMDAIEIRDTVGSTISSLSRKYSVSRTTIRNVLKNLSYNGEMKERLQL